MEIINDNNQEDAQITTGTKVGIGIGVLVLLAIIGGIVYFLLQDSTPTARIRDIFVIFLGFELLVIGFTMILLMVQAARLFNMFQNEIKPVLEAANETMSTIRGTALFLSDSVVQPAIKINSFFSTIRDGWEVMKKAFR